jgi:hypothetical protein
MFVPNNLFSDQSHNDDQDWSLLEWTPFSLASSQTLDYSKKVCQEQTLWLIRPDRKFARLHIFANFKHLFLHMKGVLT